MVDCNTQVIGRQTGSGTSKRSMKKAFNKALKNLLSNGDLACVGGSCVGGTCGFHLTQMDVSYGSTTNDQGVFIYEVEMSGSGDCRCI